MNEALGSPASGNCDAVTNLATIPATPPTVLSRLVGAQDMLARYRVPVEAVLAVGSAALAIAAVGERKNGKAIAWAAVAAMVLGDVSRPTAQPQAGRALD